jgi:tetratricopeptide (TPR) repeat protein
MYRNVPLQAGMTALLVAFLIPLPAQDWDDDEISGDTAVAERYVEWARTAIENEQWALAEEALERAADYADISSDLSYLLALARNHQNRSRRAVLEALHNALAVGRWNSYSAGEARLLLAETLIAIRSFEEALASLDLAGESSREISLRALAYRGLGDSRGFIQTITQALLQYPRSPEPANILFRYAADKIPDAGSRELISICLRRMPVLMEADPELAFLAVPCVRDTEEAYRLVSAYRAAGGTNPAGLPAALTLGIIDETQAMAELFGEPVLDKALVETVWGLFRSSEARGRFADKLSRFTGTITEDSDGDGCSESRTSYRDGTLLGYSYDADQDRLPELEVFFAAGLPVRAEQMGRPRVYLEWTLYPEVFRAVLEGVEYFPRPASFFFKPLQFRDLLGSGLLYPEREFIPQLSRRILVSYAYMIKQPGRVIPGSLEWIEMNQGVPHRSREYLRETLVADTEYLLGQPILQRIDMDLDGRLETIRRFNRSEFPPDDPLDASGSPASSESDWDGDGIYEYGENYQGDLVIRSWDMDKDGIREYTETGVRDR